MSLAGSVKRNVLASWGTHAANIVFGFFLTRYTLEVLGVSTYGSWLLINSIASYAGLLYFGFGDTISRFVAKHHSEGDDHRINQTVTLVLAVYAGMSSIALVAACGLAATAGWWGEWTGSELRQAQVTILILGVNVAVGMTGSVFGGVLHGLRRFDLERGIGFSFDIVRAVLFVVFLNAEYGLVTIAAIYFVVTVGENLSYYLVAHRILPTLQIRKSFLSLDVLKECGSFSTMAFINALAAQFINATDTVTIGLLLGKEAIVPYYFGLRLTQFAKQPIDKISTICMPTAGALQNCEDKVKRDRFLVKAIGVVMLLSGAAFIGGWFFAGDVLQLWVGSKLSATDIAMSHRILMILLGAQLIALPCGVMRAFLFGSGDVRVPACIYLFEAACNLALSICLCLWYGIEGVAWGTAVPVMAVELCVLVPYALRKLKVSPVRMIEEVVWPQVIPLLSLFAFANWVSQQSWSHGDWRILAGIAFSGAAILGGTVLARRKIEPREFVPA